MGKLRLQLSTLQIIGAGWPWKELSEMIIMGEQLERRKGGKENKIR